MSLAPINTKFIREKYDIEAERGAVEYNRGLGALELNLADTSISDVLEKVADELKNYPQEAFIQDENCSYGGGPEWNVFIKEDILETDRQVIDRLLSVERAKRKEDKKIAAAKKLLGITE